MKQTGGLGFTAGSAGRTVKPILYCSRGLNDAVRGYDTTHSELLGSAMGNIYAATISGREYIHG